MQTTKAGDHLRSQMRWSKGKPKKTYLAKRGGAGKAKKLIFFVLFVFITKLPQKCFS
jgi:hypothetical protein